jgi:hypothetical protein
MCSGDEQCWWICYCADMSCVIHFSCSKVSRGWFLNMVVVMVLHMLYNACLDYTYPDGYCDNESCE